MASLTMTCDNTPGRTLALDRDRVVLGRAPDCNVVLDVPAVSRQHACIVRTGDAYFLEDLNSRHGTYLNGQRVQARALLKDRDQIKIADWDLTFHAGTAGPVPPAEQPAPIHTPRPDRLATTASRKESSPDLQALAAIQRTLLLGRPTIDLKSQLRADAVSTPSLEVGGDFYDFYAYDQVLDVIIGDVMGKGVQAAMLGAATRIHFLRAINHLLASNPARLPEPKDILSLVVAEVYRHFTTLETFVTLCYARFDLRERRVQIVDCGHTKTIHVRRDGTHTMLSGENVPLGFLRADDYNGFTVPLDVDDTFFFYTDGVTEARKGTEDFGEDRLANLVCTLHRLDPRELVEKVSAAAVAFSAPETPKDDVTCVAVQVLDPNRSRGALRDKIDLTSDPRQAPRALAMLHEVCQKSPDLTAFMKDLGQLQQTVGEVLKYIAEHAYAGQTEMAIRVEASLFVNRFSVRIYHRGEGFDFDAAPVLKAAAQRVELAQCSRSTHGEHCAYLQKWLKE